MASLIVILFDTKCFLSVYMYIDLLKLKAYKLFENSDADLSLPPFLKKKKSQLFDTDLTCDKDRAFYAWLTLSKKLYSTSSF